jgi:transcriptional regulator with XRE-family HTH domain
MRLRKERLAAGLTQAALAAAAGITQGTVARLESAKSRRPSFVVLHALAAALRAAGRPVEAADLQPRWQPKLIKGARIR